VSTKNDIILGAYDEMMISGLTVAPDPESMQLALSRLEEMMAEFFARWNIAVGYNFQVTPTLLAQTNVERSYNNMMRTNLAVRLLASFGKDPAQALVLNATQSLSSVIGYFALQNARMIQPPRRMPVGLGNTFRGVFYNRYTVPTPLPPPDSSTNQIIEGETFDYFEDFSAWLGNATIASYTIEAGPLLTLDSDSISGQRIIYRITAAQNNTAQGPWQVVLISVTDSTGRVQIREVNFLLITVDEENN
jgi:hypothetical protein